MRLGTETGSVINHLLAGSGMPVMGGPATILSWTDRYPATVVYWDEHKKVVGVQTDEAHRIDNNGMSESQEYEFYPNPEGVIRHFRLGKNGWDSVYLNEQTKRWNKRGFSKITFGRRERFHDFSF